MNPDRVTEQNGRVTVLRVPALWRRLLATSVDAILVLAPSAWISGWWGSIRGFRPLEPDDWARWLETGAWIPFTATAVVLALLLHGALPRSLGKLATGLRLKRVADGRRVGRSRRWVRAVVGVLGVVMAGLGPAWVLASRRQRALHDLLTGTVVTVGDDSAPND